jgi:polar amino acid transport system permease protein
MKSRAFRIGSEKWKTGAILSRLDWRFGAVLLLLLAASLTVVFLRPQTQSRSVFGTLIIWMPFILKGFVLNLLMSFLAMALATVLGIGLGLMQIASSVFLRAPARLLTHLLRNSPWLVILFAVMYLVPFEFRLPRIGLVQVPDWTKATLAFSLPVMANISEILRGAVESIPRGQWDSAESLAFTRWQTLRWVILPQCIRRALPSWMNWYALLALATPMASILGVHEAAGNAQAAMEAAGARPELLAPFYLFLLCLFFAYIYPIAIWTRKLERKYAVVQQ